MTVDDRLEALNHACQRLDQEPLWHASLGSKELFHSNLVGWAIERWPDRAREVLEPWLSPGGCETDRVRREHCHLDLVIELAGYETIVVENKAFALPNVTQLDEYGRDVETTMPGSTLILLSLTDPGWAHGELWRPSGIWRYVSYRELGERLLKAFGADEDFAAQVVTHHAGLMIQLADLMDLVAGVRPDEPLALPADVQARLREIRVADAVGKARAHHTMARIRARLDELGVPDPAWAHEVGFSNGSPLLAAFWTAGDDRYVGWQYQSGQWRLAMILGDVGGKARRAERERLALEREEYFDFGRLQQALHTGNTPGRYANHGGLAFNAFEPAFLYRYRKVAPSAPVETIVELAVFYSQHAADWALSRCWLT